MRLLKITDFLSENEIDSFHRAALRIIDKVGMVIESEEMLSVLGDFGGRINKKEQRVSFAPAFEENFLSTRKRIEPSVQPDLQPEVEAGGCPLRYEDPETNEVRSFTTEDFINATRLADYLQNIKYVNAVGIPQDVPAHIHPFFGSSD